MAVKYSGLLKFTDEIKAEINLAADGTVEKAVVIDGDGVETPIGGGGDSDFTTAEVTFVRTAGASGSTAFWGAWAHDKGGDSSMQNMFAPATDTTATLVLYKGKAMISPDDYRGITAMTATGNAEVDSQTYDVSITGDCTITFSTES